MWKDRMKLMDPELLGGKTEMHESLHASLPNNCPAAGRP